MPRAESVCTHAALRSHLLPLASQAVPEHCDAWGRDSCRCTALIHRGSECTTVVHRCSTHYTDTQVCTVLHMAPCAHSHKHRRWQYCQCSVLISVPTSLRGLKGPTPLVLPHRCATWCENPSSATQVCHPGAKNITYITISSSSHCCIVQ